MYLHKEYAHNYTLKSFLIQDLGQNMCSLLKVNQLSGECMVSIFRVEELGEQEI
jgi:hypothetical protein